MKRLTFIRLTLALILLVFSKFGYSMSLFKSQNVVLFSNVNGQIMLDSMPIANAKVTRSYKWRSERSDSSLTDQNGMISFPVIEETSRSILPSQFISHQRITVEHDGKEYVIWSMGKIDPNLNGELGGNEINFICDLNDELHPVDVPEGLLVTSCRLLQGK